MRKISILAPITTILFVTLLVNTGCKKENSATLSAAQEQDAATYSAQSETNSEFVFDDVFDNVMGVNTQVGIGGTGIFGRTLTGRDANIDSTRCFTVTITNLATNSIFPIKIIIDFGNGCLGNDGHMRYGKIIITYTGKLLYPSSTATTTFDGFRIDDISVQGTYTIKNTATTSSTNYQPQYTITVTGAKLSTPDGNYCNWESTRVITQVEGLTTPIPADDVFTITGSSHGEVKHGNDMYAWHSEITNPLRKRFSCHWISMGTIKVTRETLPSNSPYVATLDYGSGACDNQATLTINGVAHQITLH